MKKLHYGIILTFASVLCLSTSSCRQQTTASKVILNEVLMENTSNAVDEYGNYAPWIELFVKYYGPVDVAGYLLEAEQDGEKVTYTIPKGDIATQVQPRQHILFWADNTASKGTLHTNFTLDNKKTTTVRLYNSNKDLLDEVVIPAGTLKANQSYARIDESHTESDPATNWEVKDSGDSDPDTYVTPNANNRVVDANSKMDKFKTQDPSGIGMALSAMAVVFSCLLLLFIAFKTVGIIAIKMAKKNELKAKGMTEAEAKAAVANADIKAEIIPGEVYAAIGLALHEMQSDVHDIEEMVLTISNENRQEDSPWNSKSLVMRHSPIRK